ncbi:hypothetical protein BBP40_010677 [Aspergillus hancockii]|nr:hypothetical protein BBP40_010677 [Aspergillus hancockii]
MRDYNFISLLSLATASWALPESIPAPVGRRQLPKDPTGVQTLQTANNVTIRYKEPGKEGVCETTPGVKSYSGYVDISPESHTFFWFFEARHNPETAPITLWLNGGPGSDSLIGLFEELGPCAVDSNFNDYINPHSWNEVSNLLFLSQPLGVGFSYRDTVNGSLNPVTGVVEDSSFAGVKGRVKSKDFSLWTESYGGHYGPAFFNHFYEQNERIANGTVEGIYLDFNSLGIINGIIDEAIQAPYYPEFAVNNTYGIKAVRIPRYAYALSAAVTHECKQVNETVYNYMKFANQMPNGCQDMIALCKQTNRTALADYAICAEATNMCRDNVEGPYYSFSGRGVYDIRHPYNDPTPPSTYPKFLAKDSVMNAIGVNINYTQSSNDVYYAFQQTGDFVWPNFIEDLEELLSLPVRVSLIYGDADYICNWFGGEAVSLATNYTHSAQFRSAGYTPLKINGIQYGETREYGNFSFTRVYEAGHEVPYYQPVASLQLFNRTVFGWDIAEGTKKIWPGYKTNGTATATHTQSSVPLPTATGTASAGVR